MKMLLEYLERAVELEKLAPTEANDIFRAELLKQASAYRELAAKRAEEYGLPPPTLPTFQTHAAPIASLLPCLT